MDIRLFLLNLVFLMFKKQLSLLESILICILCCIDCLWVILPYWLLVPLCMEILADSLLIPLTQLTLSILLNRLLDSCLWKNVLLLIMISVLGLLLVFLGLRLAALPFLALLLLLNL